MPACLLWSGSWLGAVARASVRCEVGQHLAGRRLTQAGDCARAGEPLWRTDVGAPLFTRASLLSVPAAAQPRDGTGAAGDAATSSILVVPDQAGRLHGLCLACGGLAWTHALCSSGGDGMALVRAEPVLLPPSPPPSELAAGETASAAAVRRVVWTAGPAAAGVVEVIAAVSCGACGSRCGDAEAPSNAAGSPEPAAAWRCLSLAAVAVPAETFSTPAGFDGKLVFGCRDDHLYCLSWSDKGA